MTEEEFWAALAPVAEPPPPCFRLYYDDKGEPLFYSMEEVPGNYILIDRETYYNPPTRLRVVDGHIKVLSNPQSEKLAPGTSGTACAIEDVCVVVDISTPHIKWNIKKYDPN